MKEKKLKITHFTDPKCFWCYAMEPEMRKIRVLAGDQLEYSIIMGVLVSDVREVIGYDALAMARFEQMRTGMAQRMIAAADTIGMPLSVDGLLAGGPESFVSLPLSVAYCAMRLIDETIAEAYLRRMRECNYAEGRNLDTPESLIELASEFPIDIDAFKENLDSGEAVQSLQKDLWECQAYSVFAFPTLLIEYGDNRTAMNGFYDFAAIKQAIAQLTGGDIDLPEAEYSIQALESYVDRFGKAAAREIQTMFSMNSAQLSNAMMDLVGTGRYKTVSCGTSYFVMPKEPA